MHDRQSAAQFRKIGDRLALTRDHRLEQMWTIP
jgi:hypothetical protein